MLEPCASALPISLTASAQLYRLRPQHSPVDRAGSRGLEGHDSKNSVRMLDSAKLSDEDAEFLEPSMSPEDYAKSPLKLRTCSTDAAADGASVFSNEHEFDVLVELFRRHGS